MSAGVEAAGIVLGALPLCIGIVKLYVGGAETIAGMRHHRSFLRELHRQLNMEECKFFLSVPVLFDDVTFKDPEQLLRYLTGAQGDEGQLEARLNISLPKVVVMETFVESVRALNTELDQLKQDLLALVLDEKSMRKLGRDKLFKRVAKNLTKRFKLAAFKQEEISQRMKTIRNINDDIYRIVNEAPRSPTRTIRAGLGLSTLKKADIDKIQNYYKRVRDSAQSICNVLRWGIQAPHGCEGREHAFGLCLEPRDAVRERLSLAIKSRSSSIQFKIVFLTEGHSKDASATPTQTWKELEVEPIDNAGEEEKRVKQHNPDDYLPVPSISIEHYIQPDGASKQKVAYKGCLEQVQALPTRSTTPTPQRPTTPTPQSKRVRFFENVSSSFKIPSILLSGNQKTTETQSFSPQPTPIPTPAHCGTHVVEPLESVATEKEDYTAYGKLEIDALLIHDFCRQVNEITSSRRCLGLLGGHATHKYHRVWAMPVGGCFGLGDKLHCSHAWLPNPITLRDLLEKRTPFNHVFKFSLKDRLSIGIKLASAVIQLNQTLWLGAMWGKHDIVFFADPYSGRPLIEKPMVLHRLANNSESPNPTVNPNRRGVAGRKNRVLFSLGVVLWELWYGKRLEDFSCPDEDVNCSLQPISMTENCIEWSETKLLGRAILALEDLDENAPIKYRTAVRTCLIDNIPTDGLQFMSIVWEKVLRPLEDNFTESGFNN